MKFGFQSQGMAPADAERAAELTTKIANYGRHGVPEAEQRELDALREKYAHLFRMKPAV